VIKLAPRMNPIVLKALKEKDIDISMNKPKLLTQEMADQADLIITMGCRGSDFCPGSFHKESVDWILEILKLNLWIR
jgi:arsenate reductase